MRLDEAIAKAVSKGTKKWSAIKKQQERDARAAARNRERWERGYSNRVNATDIIADVIPVAYEAAAGTRGLAHARQVYYTARQAILEKTGRPVDDKYFTQTLLPDFQRDHPELTKDWDVVYDARGHLLEPHTDVEIGIGTMEVRRYLADMYLSIDTGIEIPRISSAFPTSGYRNRYGAILYIEKEGFLPLLKQARFPERYDMAIMSSKGMGTTALRTLVEAMHGQVQILVLHDFDVVGFSIAGTLTRDTRRYQFASDVQVIDIGLRLGDIEGLPAEDVTMKGDPSNRLEMNGATDEEIDFLRGKCISRFPREQWKGQRVELNAFTSDQFVAWLDAKLRKHKVKKTIPDKATLELGYRRAAAVLKYGELLADAEQRIQDEVQAVTAPKDLAKRIQEYWIKYPTLPWDAALAVQVHLIEKSKGG